MSFDNDYPNRKDWRKAYRRGKKHSRSCRPGGSCSYCRGSRTLATQKLLQVAKEELKSRGDSARL